MYCLVTSYTCQKLGDIWIDILTKISRLAEYSFRYLHIMYVIVYAHVRNIEIAPLVAEI